MPLDEEEPNDWGDDEWDEWRNKLRILFERWIDSAERYRKATFKFGLSTGFTIGFVVGVVLLTVLRIILPR